MTSGNLYTCSFASYRFCHLRCISEIYVASILCLASVGPPTEPDITTTEFRTSRCKLHQIKLTYTMRSVNKTCIDSCADIGNLNLARGPAGNHVWYRSVAYWTSGVPSSWVLAALPSLFTSLQCFRNEQCEWLQECPLQMDGFQQASFHLFPPLCVMVVAKLTSNFLRAQTTAFYGADKNYVWPAGQQLRTD